MELSINKHYPAPDLCKMLTEIGLPETERAYTNAEPIWNYEETDIVDHRFSESFFIMGSNFVPQGNGVEKYVCPSVMEMLDTLREDRRNTALNSYLRQEDCTRMGKNPKSLPDYLATFLIWDAENGYIKSITKSDHE